MSGRANKSLGKQRRKKMTYLIRDYEAGNIIESCNTLEEAQTIVKQYEMQDKADGTFTEDFYEIVNVIL